MKDILRKVIFLSARKVRRFFLPVIAWQGRWFIGRGSRLNVPVRVDGDGEVLIGEGVSLGYPKGPCQGGGEILLQARNAESRISIGARTAVSNNVTIIACRAVEIGDDCLIADNVSVMDSDFHGLSPNSRREKGESSPIFIGDNVWLGSRVIVLKGVTIGSGSVIGAGSVVTHDVPPCVLAAGVPARIIRKLSP